MKFKAWANVFSKDEINFPFEDLNFVPEAMVEVFQDRVQRHEQRLMRLMDAFATAIYVTHIQGSINAMLKGDGGTAKMLIKNAEPEAIKEKAWIYAKVITEQEYLVLMEIIDDMKEIIKEAKETSGGIN